MLKVRYINMYERVKRVNGRNKDNFFLKEYKNIKNDDVF